MLFEESGAIPDTQTGGGSNGWQAGIRSNILFHEFNRSTNSRRMLGGHRMAAFVEDGIGQD